MSLVIWSEQASLDIQRHYAFLQNKNLDAAVRAVRAIVQAGDSLEQNPFRGTIIDERNELRRLPVSFGKFGFVLHYQVFEAGESVVIVKVYHGRENRPY